MIFDDSVKMGLVKRYPIPYFSYSQLNTFLTCPESYRLTYLTEKRERRGNKYTELGSILHDLFERQGKALIFGKQFTLQEALKAYNKTYMALKDNERTKVYFDDKEDFIKMYQKGAQALKNYYEVYEEEKPLFVERQFKKSIAQGLPPARSYIDRIDGDKDDPSSWVVTDYKTGSSPKPKAYLRKDFQLALYASQIYAEFGAYPKAVQFVHPVPQKTQTAIHKGDGVYEFTNQRKPVVEFSVADAIITITNTLADIVKAIDEDNFPLVPDSWGCKMCFFFQDGTCEPFNKEMNGWENI